MSRHRLPMHVCAGCGESYHPRNREQIFCDLACKRIGAPKRLDEGPFVATLRVEIEAAQRERSTAPLYRFWWRS